MAYLSLIAGLTPPLDLTLPGGDVLSVPLLASNGNAITTYVDGTYDVAGTGYFYYQAYDADGNAGQGDWHVQSGPDNRFLAFIGANTRAPLVVGQAQASAALAWQALGFNVVFGYDYSSTYPVGDIASQMIEDLPIDAYDYVIAGQTVVLTVSLGTVVARSTVAHNSQWLTANDIITGALRFINAYAPGESLAAEDANDALQTLNDLLESFSTDQASVFASSEAILTFVPGQYAYTIGNYDAGLFAGTVTIGSNIITNVVPPFDMVVRGDLSGTGIPSGTTIVAIGDNTITMSQVATLSPGQQQIGYTICGDFKVPRPLRINPSFTRITTQASGLDYPIDIVSQERYIEIGYKGIGAPWPIACWYNPTMPLGTLYFYQAPSAAGELHLFSDTILTYIHSLTDQLVIPQGYTRMLKRQLARELAPEFGVTWTAHHEKLAREAYDNIKSLNQVPLPVAKYDSALVRNRATDAGWILYGGFR